MGEDMRNIVLITLDSVRADHCSFMGYHRETTPTLDKMARKGLYFENAIAPSVPTGPSLVGVFTGEYTLNDSLSGDAPHLWRKEIFSRKTLAQVLSERGYTTIAVHGNPWASRLYGFNKGFNYFQDFIKEESIKNTSKKSFVNTIYKDIKNFIKRDSTLFDWKKLYPYILDWIAKAKRPYFLWVLLVDTHLPYIPPREYRVFGSKSTLRLLYLNWKIRNKFKIRKNTFKILKDRIRKNLIYVSPKDRKLLIDAYDSSILYADAFIKRLWKDLKDDDPIFIIHADHGEGFGEHGFYYHPPMLYEELIHVPLVIYNADVKGKIEKPVSLVGLASTIMDLLNEKSDFPNSSFLNKSTEWAICKVFELNKRKVAVRMKDWKFITGENDKDELYNLEKDPYEQENIIDDHSDLAKELRKIVQMHIKQELETKRIKECVLRIRGRVVW